VWQALNHGDRIGGMIIGNEEYAVHKPYRNVKSVARFLGDLARMNQQLKRGDAHPDPQHYVDAIAQIRRLAHGNYRIYLISDFQALFHAERNQWRDAFRSLSQHNEVIAMRIYDPLERQLPPADSYSVTDGDRRLQFHAGNPRLREHYEERFETFDERLKSICRQTLVKYRSISTAEPMTRIPEWS
jgi:hypothetical protein